MQLKLVLPVIALLLFCLGGSLQAQDDGEGRQQRQRRGGQQRLSRTALLQIEAVQKELELSDEQMEGITALRPNRRGGEGKGERGEGKRDRGEGKGERGEGGKGEQGKRGGEGRGGEGGRGGGGRGGPGGPGGQPPTLEFIESEMAALKDVLLEHQINRLNEIYVQVSGPGAFADPLIAKELGISEDQHQQLRDKQQEMREQVREMIQSGDRESMREQIGEMRKQMGSDLMAVLTDEQRATLETMKGDAFEMPEGAMRRPGGRRPGGGGGKGGGDRADF